MVDEQVGAGLVAVAGTGHHHFGMTSPTPLLSFRLTWSGAELGLPGAQCMTALGFLPSKGR